MGLWFLCLLFGSFPSVGLSYPTSMWSFLSYLILFYFVIFSVPFKGETGRKWIRVVGEMGRNWEGGETVIRIGCLRKKSIFNKMRKIMTTWKWKKEGRLHKTEGEDRSWKKLFKVRWRGAGCKMFKYLMCVAFIRGEQCQSLTSLWFCEEFCQHTIVLFFFSKGFLLASNGIKT